MRSKNPSEAELKMIARGENEPNISVSRDGTVTHSYTIGHVISKDLDRGTIRWFHDASDHAVQIKGFGYKSKTEAARQLVKVKERETRERGG